MFKYCADQIIKRCVPTEEQQWILGHYHENACGGHFASQKTTMNILQYGFYWPSLFKDAHSMCRTCDRCQRLGKLTHRNMMPLNPILVVDIFDVWGIDFMGLFLRLSVIHTSWWGLTMCPNGLRKSLVKTMITGWC